MSVTRITQFRGHPDPNEPLGRFLADIVAPAIRKADGNESVTVLRNEAEPTLFVVIEVWRDADAHRASANAIPPESLQRVAPLLAAPPSGQYYTAL